MLTPRGWLFLMLAVGLTALGLAGENISWVGQPLMGQAPRSTGAVAVLGLTLGLWFAAEWLLFAARIAGLNERLRVRRGVRDGRGEVDNLWAGRTFEARVSVRLMQGPGLAYVALAERVPFGVELRRGETRYEGGLSPGQSVDFVYTFRCPSAGRVRFEGQRLRTADLQGFFYHETFLRSAREYRSLPALVDARGQAPTLKRNNLLPPPGQHRHRRAGSGSELLDLRDYLPGDPPKTIAWKVSARRDRLITKDFETEVPVRCTLFVDTSDSVRLGPPGQNALAGLVGVAAAVAQAAAGSRDLVGLCLFDAHKTHTIRPARGARHLVDMLNRLADAGGLAPSAGDANPDSLIPIAYAFAREVYPELMSPRVNRVPPQLPWMSPQPGYTVRRARLVDYLHGWLPLWLPLYGAVGFVLISFLWLAANSALNRMRLPVPLMLGLVGLIGGGLALGYIRLPRVLFFPMRRRRFRYRKQLAALLSVRYHLEPTGLEALLEDDDRFSALTQRFLAEHHVPYLMPLYGRDGRYLFASPGKVRVLATALTRAVARGHDNELYVLLADLLELSDAMEPLFRAVKVALGRHHRILVVCPWPPGLQPPRSNGAVGLAAQPEAKGGDEIRRSMLNAATARFHRAYRRLRRELGRVGVPVICAESGDAPRIILDRLDLLRVVGRRR